MDEPLSLYVHIPFCRSKCAYCDFNSYAGQEALIPDYVGALLQEAEVSLEANPESVDLDYLRGLRSLGFNRLSLGVQSFDEEELRFLGRIHTAAEAAAAYDAARQAGFADVGLDLIFGLPEQRPSRWRRSLERALRLGPEHLSLYALTVAEGTPLARAMSEGKAEEPDEDAQAAMYTESEERLEAAGYEHFEISNWARPGHRCRHNLTYWETRPYLGLGAGAHSYLGGCRFANTPLPKEYIELVRASGPPEERAGGLDLSRMPQVTSLERLDAQTEMADTVILGLRLTEGVALDGFRARFGVGLEERYAQEISELTAWGLLEVSGGRLRLTKRGHLLANEAFLRFLP